jgi:hypothetical protein
MEQRGVAEEMVQLGDQAHFGSVYGGGKRVFRLDFSGVESRYAACSGVLAKVASILQLPITFSVVPEGGGRPS